MDRRNFLKATPTAVAVAVASVGLTTKTKELKAEEIQFEELKIAPSQGEVIRLWKLGSLDHGIYPTDAAIQKLASILNDTQGGVCDIIWGPDLTCEVITTEGKTVVDVIDTGKPTPEDIADKIIELMPEISMDHGNARTTIIYAIETAVRECQDAQNS